eukprot:151325-Chlamydomonas_euryale.AAC.8
MDAPCGSKPPAPAVAAAMHKSRKLSCSCSAHGPPTVTPDARPRHSVSPPTHAAVAADWRVSCGSTPTRAGSGASSATASAGGTPHHSHGSATSSRDSADSAGSATPPDDAAAAEECRLLSPQPRCTSRTASPAGRGPAPHPGCPAAVAKPETAAPDGPVPGPCPSNCAPRAGPAGGAPPSAGSAPCSAARSASSSANRSAGAQPSGAHTCRRGCVNAAAVEDARSALQPDGTPAAATPAAHSQAAAASLPAGCSSRGSHAHRAACPLSADASAPQPTPRHTCSASAAFRRVLGAARYKHSCSDHGAAAAAAAHFGSLAGSSTGHGRWHNTAIVAEAAAMPGGAVPVPCSAPSVAPTWRLRRGNRRAASVIPACSRATEASRSVSIALPAMLSKMPPPTALPPALPLPALTPPPAPPPVLLLPALPPAPPPVLPLCATRAAPGQSAACAPSRLGSVTAAAAYASSSSCALAGPAPAGDKSNASSSAAAGPAGCGAGAAAAVAADSRPAAPAPRSAAASFDKPTWGGTLGLRGRGFKVLAVKNWIQRGILEGTAATHLTAHK